MEHIPVLAKTLAEQISIPLDAVMVDATVGQGGHSFLFGQNLGPNACIIGFDVDKEAIKQTDVKLKKLSCKSFYSIQTFLSSAKNLMSRE